MKLIIFKNEHGGPIAINPDRIDAVVPFGNRITRIYLSGSAQFFDVKETYDEVMAKLMIPKLESL